MYKYFIFDLDGTVADTLDDLKSALNEMLTALDLPSVDREKVRKSINHGVTRLVTSCLPEDKREDKEFIERAISLYRKAYDERYLDSIAPYSGVIETLEELKSRKCRIALLSNKQDNCVKAIAKKLFKGCFEIAMGGGSGFPHKPSPESALFIAEKFEAKPEDVVFVGDSDVDMQTAKNAGMAAVGVAWGYRDTALLEKAGADHIIDSPKRILKLTV